MEFLLLLKRGGLICFLLFFMFWEKAKRRTFTKFFSFLYFQIHFHRKLLKKLPTTNKSHITIFVIRTAARQFVTSVDVTKSDTNTSHHHSRHRHHHHAKKCKIFIIFHDQHTSNVCVRSVIKIIKSEQERKHNKNITVTQDTLRCCGCTTDNNGERLCCTNSGCPTEIPQTFDAHRHKHRCKIVSSAIWMTDVRWWEWLWWIDDYLLQRTLKLDVIRFQVPISYVKLCEGNYKIKSLLLVVALCLSMLKIDKIISDHYFLPLLFHFSVVVVVIAVQTIHCVIVIIIIDMMRCFIINFIGNIFLYCCQHENTNGRQQHPVTDKSEQQLNILPFTRSFIVVVVRKAVKDASEQEKSIFIECEPYSRTTRNKNNNKFIINNRMRTKSCCDQITCNERTKWNMKDIFLSAVQGIELLIKFLLFLSISVYKSIISAGVCISLSSTSATTQQKDNEDQRSRRPNSETNSLSSRRKSPKNICTTFLLLFTCIPLIAGSSIHANVKYSTNIIKTKYGPLRGILVRTNPPVEAFLGVPYATPPIGSLR